MVTTLNTNIQAMNASRLININSANLAKTTERLSSGLRINRASDDPSGLAMSQVLTSQIRGDQAATGNIQQGVSMLQVADAGLGQIADVLQRMRELAVQGANGSLSASQSAALDSEFQSLKSAITNIAGGATFNGQALLNSGAAVTLQIGAQTSATTTVDFSAQSYTSAALSLTGDLTSFANSQTALGQIDAAITTVSNGRTTFGAKQQELEFLNGALQTTIVANTQARSMLTDADIASEVSNMVRQQLLQQSGASALSASNFSSQFVVSLLSGR